MQMITTFLPLTSISTQDALLKFLNTVNCNLSDNNYTIAIFLDLAKAFDSLNHEILLDKLKYYGIRNSAFSWFKSYLTNRKQFTVVNNCKSSYAEITHGVPQGSVLGPLLFLFFINDFPLCSDLINFTMFADDTNGLLSGRSLFNLREIAIVELRNISKWLAANRIAANHSKTHFMIFRGRRKLDFSLRITFEGKTLTQKSSTKMLGLHIDEKLTWSEHIHKINGKISRAIGILNKFSKILPRDTLKIIYYSVLHPHLQYCNVLWGNAAKSLVEPLFRSQKKAIRKICNAEFLAHTNHLFKDLKILKLNDLHKLETAKFVKKETSKPNSIYFTRRNNAHNMMLRNHHGHALFVPQPRSERAKRFVTYNGTIIWNNIPPAILDTRNPITFKIKLKKFLLNQY